MDKEVNKLISSETIEILGSFKYSNSYELALELITYYFKKRPSEAGDFYIVLSNSLGNDKYFYDLQYEKNLKY